MLRNLVRMRYNETPLDLNVSSIAAQYELDGAAEAKPFFDVPNPAGSTFRPFSRVLPDVSVSGSNRPTITLVPGDKLLTVATGLLYNYALGFSCFHVLAVNVLLLPKEIRPGWFQRIGLVLGGLYFSIMAVISTTQEVPKLLAEIKATFG